MTETKEYARHIVNVMGPETAAYRIASAISCLDVSRTARAAGDIGSAESALRLAREHLCDVLGIGGDS